MNRVTVEANFQVDGTLYPDVDPPIKLVKLVTLAERVDFWRVCVQHLQFI